MKKNNLLKFRITTHSTLLRKQLLKQHVAARLKLRRYVHLLQLRYHILHRREVSLAFRHPPIIFLAPSLGRCDDNDGSWLWLDWRLEVYKMMIRGGP